MIHYIYQIFILIFTRGRHQVPVLVAGMELAWAHTHTHREEMTSLPDKLSSENHKATAERATNGILGEEICGQKWGQRLFK